MKTTTKRILFTLILGSIIVVDLLYKTFFSIIIIAFLLGMLFEKVVLLWQLAKDIELNLKDKYRTFLNDEFTEKKIYASKFIKSNGLIFSD